MIGLKRGTVELAEHHDGWAELAAGACREVALAGGDLLADVQHVGSTAVPSLPAKPILDIAAGLRTPEAAPELVKRLTAIGYIYRGDGGDDSGGHLFVWEPRPDFRTIHVHAVEFDGRQWRNYLFFRDLLRRDSAIRRQYAQLKMELTSKYPDNRTAYTAAKHDLIRGILAARKDTSQAPHHP